jgi:putative phage-type endonuclease
MIEEDDEVVVESVSMEIDEERIAERIKVDTEDRKNFVGGSDAPVILGLTNWKSRFELYQEKIGERIPDDLSNVERVQVGLLIEDIIATMYMRKTGQKLRRVNKRITSMKHGFPQAVQIDRMVVGEKIPLEIKNQDAFMRDKWGDEGSADVSITYYPQIQHQIDLLDAPYAKAAVLFGGNTLVTYKIPRDEGFISDMTEAERQFWECVSLKIIPDPLDAEEAAMMWGKSPAAKVYGLPEHGQLVGFIADAKDKIKQLEAMVNAAKVPLFKALQAQGDTLIVNRKPVCTWKTQESRFFDQDTFSEANPDIFSFYSKIRTSRVLRVGKAGKETPFDPEIIKGLIAPYLVGAEAITEETE